MSTAEPVTSAPRARSTGWVVGRRFDLAFFVLPPALTALFLTAHLGLPSADLRFAASALVWLGLAQSHFGATGLFFLERANRRHYATAPLIYFGLPALLIGGYVVAGFTAAAGAALMLVPFASFWHGNRQSFGVCGLYRGLSRSFDPWTRRLELAVVFSGNACFTALGVARLDMLGAFGRPLATLPSIATSLW